MIESIRTLQELVNNLNASLKKIKSTQVYQKNIIKLSKDIVDMYFRNTRVRLTSTSINSDVISEIDINMHALLEATHKRSSLSNYRKLLPKMKKHLLEIEKIGLVASGNINKFQLDHVDKRIIDTLKKLVPSSALSYEQALIDIQESKRLSWRGPATDFREALRECLDYLAPDKEVENMPGFKLEPNTHGPTMKQKTLCILKKRELSNAVIKTAQDAVAIIDELLGSFVRSVYSRASVSTHTPTDKNEVIRIRELVKLVLCELLSIA